MFPYSSKLHIPSKKTSGLPISNPHITSKKRKLADRQGEKTVGTMQEKNDVVTEM